MKHFLLDDWLVLPSENVIQRRDERVHLEPKAMDVLCHLSKYSDRVVSAEQLLMQCWPENYLSDSVVYKNIAILRKALGEKEHGTRYITTIPKRGYRLQAKVVPFIGTNNPARPDEKADFERALRILNKLTLKQIQNEEFASVDLTLLKRNSRRLQKISSRLLEYIMGIPKYDEPEE